MNTSLSTLKVEDLIAPVFPDTLEDLGNGEYLAKWWKPAPMKAIEAFQNLRGIRIHGEPFEPNNLPSGKAIRFSVIRHQFNDTSNKQLIDDLANPDFNRSKSAKEKLISIGPDAVNSLIEALPHASNKQCWEIMRVIAHIGDPRPVPVIIEFLKAENGAIRTAAAQCLGELGDRQAVVPLIESVEWNKESGALIYIIQSLGQLQDNRAVDPLLAIMQETTSSAVRYTAIEALGTIGATRAIKPIRACLDDESHHVRDRAQLALTRLNNNNYGTAAKIAAGD